VILRRRPATSPLRSTSTPWHSWRCDVRRPPSLVRGSVAQYLAWGGRGWLTSSRPLPPAVLTPALSLSFSRSLSRSLFWSHTRCRFRRHTRKFATQRHYVSVTSHATHT
jgi:hypothetical protein